MDIDASQKGTAGSKALKFLSLQELLLYLSFIRDVQQILKCVKQTAMIPLILPN
jgi:hypothetical protein